MQKRNFLERALEGENQWWKYLLVFFMAGVGGTAIGSMPFIIVFLVKFISFGENKPENVNDIISGNLLFGLFIPITLLILVLAVILIKAFHNRTFAETVNGTKFIRWNRIFFAFGMGCLLAAIELGIYYFTNPSNFVLQFNWGRFTIHFILYIMLIPLIIVSMELLLHGYLTQGIAAATHSRRWALIIPAVIYGLAISSLYIGKSYFLLSMSSNLLYFFILGLIVILDDGIELTIGYYVGISLLIDLMALDSGEFQTGAVFSVKMSDFNTVYNSISLTVLSLIAFFIFYKKYNWNFKILNERVEKTSIHTE